MTDLWRHYLWISLFARQIFSELGRDNNKRFFATCFSWVRLSRKIQDFFGNGRSYDHHVTKSDNRKSRLSWQIWVSKWSQWSREFISGHFRFLSYIGPEFEPSKNHFFLFGFGFELQIESFSSKLKSPWKQSAPRIPLFRGISMHHMIIFLQIAG